jgi:hypothetical protein
MGHQTFNDSQTQLDLNGPLLSFTENPTDKTQMLSVSPATTDGDTTISLEDSVSAFDSDSTYTFTALDTFTVGVRLYGAAGGKNGGKGGSVSANVKFESGISYVLQVGKVGSQNGTVGVGSGGTGGANGGSGGGYTGLFRGSVSQANALLIAGGGGGGSGGITTTGLGNAGGHGGGVEGGTAKGPSGLLDGAGGGTQTDGGRRGPASLDETGGITNTSGGVLEGGIGESNILYSGGGGGGGYYGGGGGRGEIDLIPGSWGGGGGSGFISTNTDYVMAGSGGYWDAENEGAGSATLNSVFSVGSTRIFTGIATAGFSTSGYTADNAGSIVYQWYEVGVGKVVDSSTIVGSATTELTIFNLTEVDNGRKFYLETDYLPNYDASRVDPYQTGQAWNEPHDSTVGIVTVKPFIDIVNQPTDDQALVNETITYNISATSAESENLSYQWQLNGTNATSGTITRTTAANYYSAIHSVDFSHTIPSGATNVQIIVAGGSGGKGGAEDSNDPGGEGGAGFVGKFTLPDGEQLIEGKIGRRGDDGVNGADTNYGWGGLSNSLYGRGARGGASAPSPASGGGGGGGGAATAIWISGIGTVILAAGGGGGGGGSEVYDGLVGSASTYWFDYTPSDIVSLQSNGLRGEAAPLAGGGGGGGGGGISGSDPVAGITFRAGGTYGQDEISAAGGGIAGGSAYSSATAGLKSFWENKNKDGYVVLEYNTSGSDQEQVTTNTVVSGGDTPTFNVKADQVGIQTVQCVISHPTATNSPLKSDVVNFATVSSEEQFNINIEEMSMTDTANLSSINLANGEHTFDRTPESSSNLGRATQVCFYAPDRDLTIEMDLYGGKGLDSTENVGIPENKFREGGEGGYSRIRFTMKRNEEYVIVGLSEKINTPFIYRKATLIACVGEGGGGGSESVGGKGGGINVSTGESGFGKNGGKGAVAIPDGELIQRGIFGSAYPNAPLPYFGDTIASPPLGGRVLTCSQGRYWSDQGVSSCSDMSGNQKFRLKDGTVVTNTAEITRGFKAGFTIIATAGSGLGSDIVGRISGQGGHGATGGSGGNDGGGGGGGAGYTDGSVTVVDTQLGGSTGRAKVVIRSVT